MARLAGEMDEELPELAEIFESCKPVGNIQSSQRRLNVSHATKSGDMRSNSKITLEVTGDKTTSLSLKGKSQENLASSKPRRRVVLNKKSDHPLLRPVTSDTTPAKTRLARESSRSNVRSSKGSWAAEPNLLGVKNDLDRAVLSDCSLSENPSSNQHRPKCGLSRGEDHRRKLWPDQGSLCSRKIGQISRQAPTSLDIDPLDPCASSPSLEARCQPTSLTDKSLSNYREEIYGGSQGEESSDFEDGSVVLSFNPHEEKAVLEGVNGLSTPPESPSASRAKLRSQKNVNRIPPTPHRANSDAFWSQEMVDEWNDEYSPRKIVKQSNKSYSDAENDHSSVCKGRSVKKAVSKRYTASDGRKGFESNKRRLAASFLAELDAGLASNKLSQLTSSTGGIGIIWNKTLKTTAGRASWKRDVVKPEVLQNPSSITHRHHASIELAEKVIDDEDRLLNVVAHEFCHLANFMISGVTNNPHGKEFKAWAARCTAMFGHRGVQVTTKHSYTIDYKYVWECTNCGREYKRHSRSIDTTRHQCGVCKSKLVQTKPVPREGALSQYQLFVKENMAKIRDEYPGSPHKDIMGLLGQKYRENQALQSTKKSAVYVKEAESLIKPSDVDFVAEKLNFLDLSPCQLQMDA